MENVDNIIIEQLKALRSDIASMRSEANAEFKDIKARINRIERRLELTN